MSDTEWIEWNGGERAPDDWDGGMVKFRDGIIGHTGVADSTPDSCCWQNDAMPEDIVAYRRKHITKDPNNGE